MRSLAEAVERLRRENDELEEHAAPAEPGIVAVRDAVGILGVSRDLIDRTIKDLPEGRRPSTLPSPRGKNARHRYYWPDPDALRAWWADVTAPAPSKPKRAPRATRPNVPTEVVEDWSKVR
jgi:hypothetical protein